MRTIIRALALTLVAHPIAAQSAAPDVPLHTRVRVALPDSVGHAWPRRQWLRGEVAAKAVDTLYLKLQGTGGTVAIPRTAIRHLHRSLGVPSRPESALRAAVGWGVLGAALGYATGWPDWNDGRSTRSAGDRTALGAAAGAAAGFVLGAIFPSERWRRVRLR
jgi:hypothetical protein